MRTLIVRFWGIAVISWAFVVLSGSAIGVPWAGMHSSIQVHDAWIRAVPPNATTTAAYMVLENKSGQDDQLIGARSPIAKKLELHNVRKEGEMMQMYPVKHIDVPTHGSTTLQPGGLHIMLIDLKAVPKAGEEVSLILAFQHAGDVELKVPVKESQMGQEKSMKHEQQHMAKPKTN
jgi:hypothetical protein